MTPDEQFAELEAENAALREQVTVLAERLHELEARLAKDSGADRGAHPITTGMPTRSSAVAFKVRNPGACTSSGVIMMTSTLTL